MYAAKSLRQWHANMRRLISSNYYTANRTCTHILFPFPPQIYYLHTIRLFTLSFIPMKFIKMYPNALWVVVYYCLRPFCTIVGFLTEPGTHGCVTCYHEGSETGCTSVKMMVGGVMVNTGIVPVVVQVMITIVQKPLRYGCRP